MNPKRIYIALIDKRFFNQKTLLSEFAQQRYEHTN